MYQDIDLDPRINPFVLDMNVLKKNKDILKYIREYYNFNKPIKTKKKLDYLFYLFEMNCSCIRMNDYIYNLLKNL